MAIFQYQQPVNWPAQLLASYGYPPRSSTQHTTPFLHAELVTPDCLLQRTGWGNQAHNIKQANEQDQLPVASYT